MGDKFSTINPINLAPSSIPSQIPEWMEGIMDGIRLPVSSEADLGGDQRGIFAEYHPLVQRLDAEATGEPRHLEQGVEVHRVIHEAKLNLAKFLSHKRYQVKEGYVDGNTVNLRVTLDAVPASFTFPFIIKQGRTVEGTSFTIDPNAEYPFSLAGLREALQDLKQGTVKTAVQPQAVGKHYVISREEIIRRYNGSLKAATDAINAHLKEGSMIGMGSNTYGTFFDVDQLFPQQVKESIGPKTPEFEFVANNPQFAPQPHRSAQLLTLDAIKVLGATFSEVTILGSQRDNEELLVKASVLNARTGARTTVDFAFAIEGENLGAVRFAEVNEKRLAMGELIEALNTNGNEVLDQYLKQVKVASKHAHQMVLTRRDVRQRLHGIVKVEHADQLLDAWVRVGMVQPINSTTFSTNHTFEELLNHVSIPTLTSDESAKLAAAARYFGEGLGVDVDQAKPILERPRTWEDVEVNEELRLAKLTQHLSSHLKRFTLGQVVKKDDDNYDVMLEFIDTAQGVRNALTINALFTGNSVTQVVANVNGLSLSLPKLVTAFRTSTLLNAYVTDSKTREAGPIVISNRTLQVRLASLVGSGGDQLITHWLQTGALQDLGSGLYASPSSFEELLREAKVNPLTTEEARALQDIKRFFGDGLEIHTDRVGDTGVRRVQVHLTDELLFQKVNARLAQEFKHYQPIEFFKDDDNYVLRTELSNEDTGLRHMVDFVFHFDEDQLTASYLKLPTGNVSLHLVKKAFALSEPLSRYLEGTPGKRVQAPVILKTAELTRRLSQLTSEDPHDVMVTWEQCGWVDRLDSMTLASSYTFEELIQASNILPLGETEIEARIAKSARSRHLALGERAFVADTGDRRVKEGGWSPKRLTTYAYDVVGKHFKDFTMLNAEFDVNNNLNVQTSVINPFSGTRVKLAFNLELNEGRPTGIHGFVDTDSKLVMPLTHLGDYLMKLRVAPEVQQFNDVRGSTAREQVGVISTQALQQHLGTVVAPTKFADSIQFLSQQQLLRPINASTWALTTSLPILIQRLAEAGYTDLGAGKEQQTQARRAEHQIDVTANHVQDNDTRGLTQNGSMLPELLVSSKTKLTYVIQEAQRAKRITPRTATRLMTNGQAAQSFNELQQVVNDFQTSLG